MCLMNEHYYCILSRYIVLKFPIPRRKSHLGSARPCGCAVPATLSLHCLRVVAWLDNLNRLVPCKLFSPFSTLVKEFHQVVEEIPRKQALEKMPETHQLFCSCGRLEKSL